MRLRYLLDTNAISEPLKPRPNQSFMEHLRAREGQAAISAVTWNEALYGLQRLPTGRRRMEVEEYLVQVVAPSLPVLAYDSASAEWHAVERARLAKRGRHPSFADGQIAAIAKVNGLVLVTRNVRDFSPFSELDVENWWE